MVLIVDDEEWEEVVNARNKTLTAKLKTVTIRHGHQEELEVEVLTANVPTNDNPNAREFGVTVRRLDRPDAAKA